MPCGYLKSIISIGRLIIIINTGQVAAPLKTAEVAEVVLDLKLSLRLIR